MNRRHIDLFSGKKDFVGRFEDGFVRIGGESLVTDVGAYVHRKFVRPQSQNVGGAATVNQLLWAFAHVIN